MSEAYDRMVAFLESEDIRCQKVEESELAIITFRDEDGPIRCYFRVYQDNNMAEMEAYAPVAAPRPRRTQMCRLACLVNRYTVLGCLSVDPEEGEILYRAASTYPDTGPEPEFFDRLLHIAMTGLRHHLPAINAVVFQGKSAADAIAMLEPSDSDEEDAEEATPDAPESTEGESTAGT